MTELPPGIQLYQLGIGHYVSRAMYLAAKLDLAGHIARGARDFRALAKATDTDAPSLRRVLRLLASVGIFEELDERRVRADPARRHPARRRAGLDARERHALHRPGNPGRLGRARVLRAHRRAGLPEAPPERRRRVHEHLARPGGRGDLRQGDGDLRAADLGGDRGRLRLRPVREAGRRGRRQRRAHDRDPAREPEAARARLRPAARDRARAGPRRLAPASRTAASSSAAASSRSCRAAPTPTC